MFIHALIRTVIVFVLATLAVRAGYRIGYRDALLGRRPRIPVCRVPLEPREPNESVPRIAGYLPAIGQTCDQEVSIMTAASNPLSCILGGTVTGLNVHGMLDPGEEMALFTLVNGSRSTVCVVLPKVLADCRGVLAEGAHVRVSGTLESSIDFIQLAVTAIEPLT